MSHIVAIQSTYQTVELGLFDGTQCLAEHIIDKKDASGQLIPSLASLCNTQHWHLPDVAAIITNQGPGPFTTLRTVIVTVNGLSFASGVPLIGINALEALITEFDPDLTHTVLALLNAFGGDVYYGIRYARTTEFIIGVNALVDLLPQLKAGKNMQVIGNGAASHLKLLHDTYGKAVTVHADMHHASLKTIANMGLKQIHDGSAGVHHLSPCYLKNHPAKPA
jgi:tRNA threonylcarbamoyl adenosine modification protein YeaZ